MVVTGEHSLENFELTKIYIEYWIAGKKRQSSNVPTSRANERLVFNTFTANRQQASSTIFTNMCATCTDVAAYPPSSPLHYAADRLSRKNVYGIMFNK